jgi:hypothetical protein
MSEIKVNNIQSLGGTNGPVISGTVEMNSTGAMSLPRGDTTYRGGRGRGIFGGGRTSPEGIRDTIDYFTIATLGNATDFGNLTTSTSEFGGCASSTRGIFMGGETFPTNINVIQYLTISQLGNTFDFGDLTSVRRANTCLSNNVRGISLGGNLAPTLVGKTHIDYITIATTGNSSKFGDLTTDSSYGMAGASTTRGIIALGNNPFISPYGLHTNVVEYITISTEGNSKDFGDLTVSRREGCGASNSTRAVIFGGNQSPNNTNIIDYMTIASLGDAIDFGDCINGSSLSNACSSPTRAIFGDMTSDGDSVSYVTINTLGNAQDFGNLDLARNQTAGFSDSHGGLG